LQTRKWQDSKGNDCYTTEIVVSDFPKKLPRYWTKNGQSAHANSQQQMSQDNGQGYMGDQPPISNYDDVVNQM